MATTASSAPRARYRSIARGEPPAPPLHSSPRTRQRSGVQPKLAACLPLDPRVSPPCGSPKGDELRESPTGVAAPPLVTPAKGEARDPGSSHKRGPCPPLDPRVSPRCGSPKGDELRDSRAGCAAPSLVTPAKGEAREPGSSHKRGPCLPLDPRVVPLRGAPKGDVLRGTRGGAAPSFVTPEEPRERRHPGSISRPVPGIDMGAGSRPSLARSPWPG